MSTRRPTHHQEERRTYVLLPLPEAGLLGLDLLGEALAERLLLLLELGVLELSRLLFAKLANLHLSLTVVLVVEFFGGRDEVQHVCADEKGTEFTEVAVAFVLNCGDRLDD